MAKPVIPSGQALADIDEAWSFYLGEAGLTVVDRFIDALETAFGAIGRQPGIGSPRWAHELGIEGLRSWRITGYPYLLVYFEPADAVDVVRVLHGARDLPATLVPEDPA
jgi:toxin ParE1/3/4